MSEESLQNRINSLPKEHRPMTYEVLLFDKKGNFTGKRYVRASSPERAKLAGYKVDRYTFGCRNAYRASASPYGVDIMPADYDLMDYENAAQDFRVEYSFINEDGHDDVDDIVFCAMDADDAQRKFEQRFANEIVSIQAV